MDDILNLDTEIFFPEKRTKPRSGGQENRSRPFLVQNKQELN